MKVLKIALATAALAGFASTAAAQDGQIYGNVGVKTYEFDTYNILGRLGYNFSENFGVEGEGSIGVSGDTVLGVDVDTNWDLGFYLVGRYPVSQDFEFFGRVGYSTVEVEAANVTADIDGFAIGGGLQYNFDDTNGVRIGYTYNDGDAGINADVIDLAYVRNF